MTNNSRDVRKNVPAKPEATLLNEQQQQHAAGSIARTFY